MIGNRKRNTMRPYVVSDIPTRTGWDIRRDRERIKAQMKRVLGWVFLLSLSGGIGAIVALTSFPR